ncbi:2894_t:CDS:2 [Entrophospora sp. SA101]|nr:2894_t:CDS:2 [Entrophospora sp. SA101]
MDKVLEEKEVKLVQAAFNFDELQVAMVFTPRPKVITLNENMTLSEIQKIHAKYFFNCYPVLNKKKEVQDKKFVGVISHQDIFDADIETSFEGFPEFSFDSSSNIQPLGDFFGQSAGSRINQIRIIQWIKPNSEFMNNLIKFPTQGTILINSLKVLASPSGDSPIAFS